MVVVRGAEHHVQRDLAQGLAFVPEMMSLNCVWVSLMQDDRMSICSRVARYKKLRLLSPSIRTLVRWQPSTIGSSTRVAFPGRGTWSG